MEDPYETNNNFGVSANSIDEESKIVSPNRNRRGSQQSQFAAESDGISDHHYRIANLG